MKAGYLYRLEFFADRDGSGDCSGTAPDVDHSWAPPVMVSPAGIEMEFSHTTPFDELEFFVLVPAG